ncbi:histone acetylation protein-domain-containing protein [Hypomontagnella submonticulosa]|nr:histone acetylation protein-domain-containing protein [Hypomontagnella submonticulosa]
MSSPSEARNGGHVVNPHPLVAELAKVLPKDHKFTAFHLSTPPTTTEPLCHPPAYKPASEPKVSGDVATKSKDRRPSKPLKTYCEKHFLAISINVGKQGTQNDSDRQVLVLALEIYIYTTSFSTIIFVSKADSTGYLTLLGLPEGSPSPIREATACFLAFLVANRRRPTKQLVVNLFARAQSQYLFPGSVKNSSKHVLDDRGLVKWWCRVLNSLLEGANYVDMRKPWDDIHGYLLVPGLDNYETRAFLPRTSLATTNWTLGHPLEKISPYTKNPGTFGGDIHARCLIPMYPDDPKARFVEELEESTPEKAKLATGWKSPKTLDQFWEMMAFRQECSSGRLTGFIWVVFEPQDSSKSVSSGTTSAAVVPNPNASISAPTNTKPDDLDPSLETPVVSRSKATTPKSKRFRRKRKGKKALTGPIIPRKPQIKTHQQAKFPQEVNTPYYYWPENGRGQVVLSDSSYKRAIELLLHLEFGNLEQAMTSTARWTKEVNMGENWALEIVGERAATTTVVPSSNGGVVNNLSGMVRRKRGSDDQPQDGSILSTSPVNTLGGGLVRKKAKLDTETPADESHPAANPDPKVNVLGAGLVRRKSKAS